MKKILTLVAAIVFATATQAACYNWETSLGEGYDGMTWYVVNGAGSANIVSILATDGNIEGFLTAMSGANVQTGTFQEGWGGWQDGLVTDASSSAYLVVINKLEAEATFYYSADLSTEDYQYTPSRIPWCFGVRQRIFRHYRYSCCSGTYIRFAHACRSCGSYTSSPSRIIIVELLRKHETPSARAAFCYGEYNAEQYAL